jgi:hypothetical protein
MLLAEVREGDVEKTYLVASAHPAEFECHMCSPSIGVAVFAWDGKAWILESANAAVGFYGEYGDAPESDLVLIGPKKHGVILWNGDLTQGYSASTKRLLAPVGKTVSQTWWIRDEQDNAGAVDPDDKSADHALYHAEATFKFTWNDDMPDGEEYYDIIVMSRGTDEKGNANWTKVFRFRDGQYRLLSAATFVETKTVAKKPTQPPAATRK